MYSNVPFGEHRATAYKAIMDRLLSRFSPDEKSLFFASYSGAGKRMSRTLAEKHLLSFYLALAQANRRGIKALRRLGEADVMAVRVQTLESIALSGSGTATDTDSERSEGYAPFSKAVPSR